MVGTLLRHLKWNRSSRGIANCCFIILTKGDGEKVWCSIYGPDADHLYKEIKVGEEITVEGNYPKKQKTRGPKIFAAKEISTKYYRSHLELIRCNYGSVGAYAKAKKYQRRVGVLRPKAYEIERVGDRDAGERAMTNDQYAKVRFYNLEIDKRSLSDAECRDLINELTKSIKMQDTLRQRVEMWRTIAGSYQRDLKEGDSNEDDGPNGYE